MDIDDIPDTYWFDEIENAVDSLETASIALSRQDKFKWKWVALALHHSLYSYCISLLVQGYYPNVLSSGYYNDDKNRFMTKDDGVKWKKSKKNPINNSPAYTISWEETDEVPLIKSKEEIEEEKRKRPSRKLINFWTALARVQDQEYWMGRMMNTRALRLLDKQLKNITWLTLSLRNDFMHFIPKICVQYIPEIKEACNDIINVIEFLAFTSNRSIYVHKPELEERAKQAIEQFRANLSNA